MSKTVLVSGGAGYIGSHVVHALRDGGYTPVVVDNLSTGNRTFIPEDVPFLEANITDSHSVRSFIQEHACQAVIHLAGVVSVEESVLDPMGYYDKNTCASHSFISSCVAEKMKHFIFSSSASVYGNPDVVTVSEALQPNPISPYGWSKLMTEKMLEDICSVEPMNAISLRYFNVAGADPQGRSGLSTKNATHLIKVLCETATGVRPSFTVFGNDYNTADGTCIRDFIHVSDLASIHIAALEALIKGCPTQTINCGYGHGYSVQQVVDTLTSIIQKPLNVEIGPRRNGDIVALIADVEKMHQYLDWHPQYDDLQVILETALQWERHLQTLHVPADD